MSRAKCRIVPPVVNAKYEVEYGKRPTNFSVLTVWPPPDELNFVIRQLEDAKREYCIEHHTSNSKDNNIRVWSKSFTGFNWYSG